MSQAQHPLPWGVQQSTDIKAFANHWNVMLVNTALVDTEFPYLLTNFNVIEDQGATNQLLYYDQILPSNLLFLWL